MNIEHYVFLGLGSNLGDKRENLACAIRLIGERVGKVLRVSSFIETEPWGFESENGFVNAAVKCETMLSPRQVLRATQKIEREMGRKKKSTNGGYADRCIDIDILLYDELRVDEPDLQIPHPLMFERDFVMIPLKEITEQNVL